MSEVSIDSEIIRLKNAGVYFIESSFPDVRSLHAIEILDIQDILSMPNRPEAIFIEKGMFEDDVFNYTPEEFYSLRNTHALRQTPDHFYLLEVPAEYNLLQINPSLRDFTQYVGKYGFAILLIPYQGMVLKFSLSEPWWEDFEEAIANSKILVDEIYEKALEDKRKDLLKANQAHVDTLTKLASDEGFIALASIKKTTQKTLLRYAANFFPEAIDHIGETHARDILAELAEKIRFKV